MADLKVNILIKAMNMASAELDKLGGQLRSMDKGFSAIAVGGGAVSVALGLMGKQIIDRGAEFEKYRAILATVLKSQEAANKAIQQTTEFAATTPFEVGELVQANVQMTALGLNAEKFLPIVGDFAASMQIDLVDASRSVGRALQGVPEGFETMRNAGITNTRLLQAGWSGATDDMSSKSKALLKVLVEDFAGGMERQSKTFAGATSNMQDAISNLQRKIAAELLPTFTVGIRYLTTFIDKMREMIGDNAKIVAWGGVTVGAMSGILAVVGGLGLAIPRLIDGIKASGALLTWLATNPVVLGIAAFVALAGAIALATGKFDTQGQKVVKYVDKVADLKDKIAELEKSQGSGLGARWKPVIENRLQGLRDELAKTEKQAEEAFSTLQGTQMKTPKMDTKSILADLQSALPPIMGKTKDFLEEKMKIGKEAEDLMFNVYGPFIETQEQASASVGESAAKIRDGIIIERESMAMLNEGVKEHARLMEISFRPVDEIILDVVRNTDQLSQTVITYKEHLNILKNVKDLTAELLPVQDEWNKKLEELANAATNAAATTQVQSDALTSYLENQDKEIVKMRELAELSANAIQKEEEAYQKRRQNIEQQQKGLASSIGSTLKTSLREVVSVLEGDQTMAEAFKSLGSRFGFSFADAIIDSLSKRAAASLMGMLLPTGEGTQKGGGGFGQQAIRSLIGVAAGAAGQAIGIPAPVGAAIGGAVGGEFIDVVSGAAGQAMAAPAYQPVVLTLENRGEPLARGVFKANRSRIARGEVDSGRTRDEG